METHLLETVRNDLKTMQAAADRSDGDEMTAALRRLDATVREKGDRLPTRLAHFLERRSYEKALDFLETETAPGGGAGAKRAPESPGEGNTQ